MEILLNELSLDKQFSTLDDFIENSLFGFVEIVTFFIESGNCPMKNYDFYNCKITQIDTFYSLITNKSIYRISDIVRKYKTTLDRINREPFWESNKLHNTELIYSWNDKIVTGTSVAESFERNSFLISFKPSKFELDKLIVQKEYKETKEIHNITELNSALKYLYDNNCLRFYDFCKYYYKETKLSFEHINKEKSFDLISDKKDENEFLNSFNMFSEMTWFDIIAQGGKGENKVGLAYSKYHKQEAFSSYNLSNIIDKFRCSQKIRVFGYRNKDKFYVLEFDMNHRLSD
jgi:hypothetical protein